MAAHLPSGDARPAKELAQFTLLNAADDDPAHLLGDRPLERRGVDGGTTNEDGVGTTRINLLWVYRGRRIERQEAQHPVALFTNPKSPVSMRRERFDHHPFVGDDLHHQAAHRRLDALLDRIGG